MKNQKSKCRHKKTNILSIFYIVTVKFRPGKTKNENVDHLT